MSDEKRVVTKGMVEHVATCRECERSCGEKNAFMWAASHAAATGHSVEVRLGYLVTCEKV